MYVFQNHSSVLGQILVNLFYKYNNHHFANHADDTTRCVMDDNTIEVLTCLTDITLKLLPWFAYNH